eukprot:5037169-Pyramimonas_sp.AAC.1
MLPMLRSFAAIPARPPSDSSRACRGYIIHICHPSLPSAPPALRFRHPRSHTASCRSFPSDAVTPSTPPTTPNMTTAPLIAKRNGVYSLPHNLRKSEIITQP